MSVLDVARSDSEQELPAAERSSVESFRSDPDAGVVVRTVARRSGGEVESSVALLDSVIDSAGDEAAKFDSSWLRSRSLPSSPRGRDTVRVVDLFSGCGAMTVGVAEAARALGLEMDPRLAIDFDEAALRVLARNFPRAEALTADIAAIFGSSLHSGDFHQRNELRRRVGRIQILLGGPPCQGHSNLNNHSRRADPKNRLFLAMADAAELFEPDHVIVENVRDIVHDEDGVFDETCARLEALGYSVDAALLKSEELGVAQRRHRMFLVASKKLEVRLAEVVDAFRVEERSFDWACGDLAVKDDGDGFDTPSKPMSRTRERMRWLFENDSYDLPNELRPPCQRSDHSYVSVYGRIRPHEPAQTITTGFTYMGQGRYVHPYEPRTITPHEAARLQFIPDHFEFGRLSRSHYKSMIGNAVPPKLSYLLALHLLR